MSETGRARTPCLGVAMLLLTAAATVAAQPSAHPALDATRKDNPIMMKADRLPPDTVAPVTIHGVRYEAIHWGRRRGLDQDGGYIAAIDVASGRELWTLKIYSVPIDPGMERDGQDVFITALGKTFFGGKLKVADEQGRHYLVDVQSRSVRAEP